MLPSLIPTLQNIGILLHKKANLGKHFQPECIYLQQIAKLQGSCLCIYNCSYIYSCSISHILNHQLTYVRTFSVHKVWKNCHFLAKCVSTVNFFVSLNSIIHSLNFKLMTGKYGVEYLQNQMQLHECLDPIVDGCSGRLGQGPYETISMSYTILLH